MSTTEDVMTDLLYELYVNWRRLKGYPSPAIAPLERAIDAAAGLNDEDIMKEFGEWLLTDALQRIQPSV